jgi:serine/alanine adding enzyme
MYPPAGCLSLQFRKIMLPLTSTTLNDLNNNQLKLKLRTGIDTRLIGEWDRFIEDHVHGSVLQSFFSYQLFDQTKFFTPVFLACSDDEDRLQGLVLGVLIREKSRMKGLLSTRLVVYGGPLVNEQHPEKLQIFAFLLDHLIKAVEHKSIFIQFRASYDLSAYQDVFAKFGFKWVPRLNLLIDISSEKQYANEMSASRRRQVKRSLANGAKITVPSGLEQVREFYTILSDLYRYKVRKPLPDWSFFEAFYRLMHQYENGKFLLITYDNRVIGGIMSPYSRGKSLFEWYVCGLDTKYKSKGIYPSVLATWAAINYAGSAGCKTFDFMGVGKPDEPYGVRDFKMKFGGSTVNYGRYIRINNQWRYTIAEMGYNFLSFMKKV